MNLLLDCVLVQMYNRLFELVLLVICNEREQLDFAFVGMHSNNHYYHVTAAEAVKLGIVSSGSFTATCTMLLHDPDDETLHMTLIRIVMLLFLKSKFNKLI